MKAIVVLVKILRWLNNREINKDFSKFIKGEGSKFSTASYDFSKGERGKFFYPNSTFNLPKDTNGINKNS